MISKNGQSRMGKHRVDKVSIGFYATVNFKALLAYVVDQSGETATDILMAGVLDKARRLGIVDADGKIISKHAPDIQLIADVFKNQKRNNKE